MEKMEEIAIIDLQEYIESARITAGALFGYYGNDGNYDKCVFFQMIRDQLKTMNDVIKEYKKVKDWNK
jgi:hypothetical protein